MNVNLKSLVWTAALVAAALSFQAMGFPVETAGVVINSVLVLATVVVGPLAGAVIGLVTPWVAALSGVIDLSFMTPFIMIGNVTLVAALTFWQKESRFVGVVAGAFAKYLVFILAANFLLPVIGQTLTPQARVVFGIQQLASAIAGGLLALAISDTLEPWINKR